MCSIQFKVKDLSTDDIIIFESANGNIDICTTFTVGKIVSIVGGESNIQCAEILEVGSPCATQNPCSADPNDILPDLGTSLFDDGILTLVSPKYLIVDCASINPITQTTEAAFDFYDGKVIKTIQGDPSVFVCYTVEKVICSETYPSFDLGGNIIVDYFPTCIECLTVKPTTEEEIKKRTVSPGYNTPGCSPEYYDKISCKFSETIYQEIAKKRYGIDFCCEDDADKWDVKKELLYLAAKTDPNICETICPTDTVECAIKCLNVNTCDLDLQTFAGFVSNGTVNFNELIDLYNGYQTTNPTVYADLNYFECMYGFQFCINLCFYTASCFQTLIEQVEFLLDKIKICDEISDSTYQEINVFYDQQVEEIQICIDILTKFTSNIEIYQAQLAQCQEELQALIDAGAPQVDIIAKTKECADINDSLQASIEELEFNETECGGTIIELTEQITIIQNNQLLETEFYNAYQTALNQLKTIVNNIRIQLENAETCNVIFPFLYESMITYTACNGTQVLLPVLPSAKIYSQVTSTYIFSNSGYASDDYNTVINNIISISDECVELPACSLDTNLPQPLP